jgi:hypothetical protein
VVCLYFVFYFKASHTLGCTGKHTVRLVLVVTQQEIVGLTRCSGKTSPSGHTAGNCRTDQMLRKPKYLSAAGCDREERVCGEGAVAITNGPVSMCERVALGRGGCRLARAISAVIYM